MTPPPSDAIIDALNKFKGLPCVVKEMLVGTAVAKVIKANCTVETSLPPMKEGTGLFCGVLVKEMLSLPEDTWMLVNSQDEVVVINGHALAEPLSLRPQFPIPMFMDRY